MSRQLLISKRAEADLLDIWLWTYERFGEAQADRYLDELGNGMGQCGAAPESGKDRRAIRAGYRSLLVGSHVLFYTYTDAEVIVRRVLHAGMDFDAHRIGRTASRVPATRPEAGSCNRIVPSPYCR